MPALTRPDAYPSAAAVTANTTNEEQSPFVLMMRLFLGLKISLVYGLSASALILLLVSKSEAQSFFTAYTTSFKTLVSLGLIVGTALIVFRSQNVIPVTIENAFKDNPLPDKYYAHKRNFSSRVSTAAFSAQFVVVAFALFTLCQFPLSGPAEAFMLVAACAEYGLAVYVGRKLLYAGLMLHSLLDSTVTRNLFRRRELDDINSYVHIVSTLTVIFTYVNVMSYYQGPFLYNSVFGQSIKPFLLLLGVIAMPVLLMFNFYPRAVLRKLYSQSIDLEIQQLKDALHSETLSDFEKRSYLMEVDKMSRDELRYSLQLTLGDLPIGITVMIMVLQPIISR